VLLPATTPRAPRAPLNADMARILADLNANGKVDGNNFILTPSTPEEYGQVLRGQVESLRKVVLDAGMQLK